MKIVGTLMYWYLKKMTYLLFTIVNLMHYITKLTEIYLYNRIERDASARSPGFLRFIFMLTFPTETFFTYFDQKVCNIFFWIYILKD